MHARVNVIVVVVVREKLVQLVTHQMTRVQMIICCVLNMIIMSMMKRIMMMIMMTMIIMLMHMIHVVASVAVQMSIALFVHSVLRNRLEIKR
jgi:hypothetical protein